MVALFRTIGPKRTRLAAQIVAAIVGATFVIGLQIAAILSYGTLSYFTFLKSDLLVSLVPAVESVVWWPARAVLGDMTALAAVLSGGTLLLAAAIALFSARFGDHATAAAGVSDSGVMQRRWRSGFRRVSPSPWSGGPGCCSFSPASSFCGNSAASRADAVFPTRCH
jgi:ABC-2 type transport system permease protein